MSEFDDNEPIGDLRKRFEAQLDEMKKSSTESQKAAAEAAARAEAAERKLAFAEAGIPLSDKRAQLFVKGYDGELEADKVKAAWNEYFGAPAQPQPTPQGQSKDQPQPELPAQVFPGGTPFQQDAAALGQMDAAVTSGQPPQNTGADLLGGMRQLYEQGATAEEVARFLGAHGYPVAPGHE